MKVSMNRIRSDMKKLNTDSFYVGTYETVALLLQDFPEWKNGKKPPVGGKICDSNSWAYVGKDSTYDTYKFNEKGKWKKISGGGGVTDHESLSGIQGGNSTEHVHLTVDQLKNVDSCKGYYLSEQSLYDKFPNGSPLLKGGEYCFVDDPDVGLYMFCYTNMRDTWVRDASISWLSRTELEKDGILLKSYATLNPTTDSLRLRKQGHKMAFECFTEGKGWELITLLGSVTTDSFNLINNTDGSIVGINDITPDLKYHNVFRRDIWGNVNTYNIGNEFGSFDRSMALSANTSDGLTLSYPKESVVVDVQIELNTEKPIGTYSMTFKPSSDIEFSKAEFMVKEATRARMYIRDNVSKELIYESQTLLDSRDSHGIEIIDDISKATTGKIVASFPRIGFCYGERDYTVFMEVIEGVMLGNENFIYFKIHGEDWKDEIIATREWVNEQPFVKPQKQTLQQVLELGNRMNPETNIVLDGTENVKKYNVDHSTYTSSNGGTIELTRDGWSMKSLNLQTVTPKEPNSVSIHLAPEDSPISPKVVKYRFYDVPQEPINMPDNITFETLEMDGSIKTIPYIYTIDKTVTPYDGYFTLQLDGRQIKSLSITFHKFSAGGYPDFSKWGYLCEISGSDGDSKQLFQKIDEQYKINPSLINESWEQIPDSNNIKPSNGRQTVTDSIYHLAEDIVGKVEALPLEQRYDVTLMKNFDKISKGNYRSPFPDSLDDLVGAKKGDWWKQIVAEKIVIDGVEFFVNDELFCLIDTPTKPEHLAPNFVEIPYISDRIQSDWSVTNTEAPDYIKNKPVIIAEANSDDKVYGRKNKTWIPLTDIQEPLDTFSYLRTLGKWVKHVDKFNLCAFGDKSNYLKDEFASYNGKLYRALKETFRSPDYTTIAKVDTGVPIDEPYNVETGGEYTQIQIFVPFVSNSNQTITGFRLNIETTAPIENSYICLMERVMSSGRSVSKVLTVEKFTANNGNSEYKLTTPFSVTKDKNYELFVLLPSNLPIKVMGSYMAVLENAIFKVGLIKGTPYSTAYDQRKKSDTSIPYIGSEYVNHQGTWASGGMMCLTPIIESTTVKNWIEVVGSEGGLTEVHWNDILDKPANIITEETLNSVPHDSIQLSNNKGKGIYTKDFYNSTKDRNIVKYSRDINGTQVGDIATNTEIEGKNITASQVIETGRKEFYPNQAEILPDLTYVSSFTTSMYDCKIEAFVIKVDKPCTVSIRLNEYATASTKACVAGINVIDAGFISPIPSNVTFKLTITTDTPSSLMGATMPSPTPYFAYDYTIIKQGDVLTSVKPIRKMELHPEGALTIKDGDYQNKLISMQRDRVHFGSVEGQTTIASSSMPNILSITEYKGVPTTDKIEVLDANRYVYEIPNIYKDYYIKSADIELGKSTTVSVSINSHLMGDDKLYRNAGIYELRATEPFQTTMEKISIMVTTPATSGKCLVGDNTLGIPKLNLNLVKMERSQITNMSTARNIMLQESDNIVVHGNLTGQSFPYDLYNLSFTAPEGKSTPYIVDMSDDTRAIVVDGDCTIGKDESLIITVQNIAPLHEKSRILMNLDMRQKSGYVNVIKMNKETITVKSMQGEELRPELSYNLSDERCQLQVAVDYVLGDYISIKFGEGNVFSDTISSFQISEYTLDLPAEYKQSMFNTEGRIDKSLMNSEYTTRDDIRELAGYSRNINVYDGDNIFINTRIDSKKYTRPEIMSQASQFITYEVSDVALYDIPTIGAYENKYSTIYGAKSNITTGGFIKTKITNLGGCYNVPRDRKAIVTYYLYNTTKAPVLNIPTITLLDDTDTIIPSVISLEVYENNAKIEFAVDKLSSPMTVSFGEGNDLSGCSVIMEVSTLGIYIHNEPMFDEFGKISKSIYEYGWDKKLDLTKENIDITKPISNTWQSAQKIQIKAEGFDPLPKTVLNNGITTIDYGANCIFKTNKQRMDINLTVPANLVDTNCSLEYHIEFKDTPPTINPNDIMLYRREQYGKMIRVVGNKVIVVFEAFVVPRTMRIRIVGTQEGNLITDLSNCTTTFLAIKSSVLETVPMFVDNKINGSLYDGWDMKIDMTAQQNVNITKQSSDTKYTPFHTIPFKRASEWIPNEYIRFDTIRPVEALTECTHFTIKGIDPPSHYTDISVKYRLEVKIADESVTNIDCVACTGLTDNIYNKITSPIPAQCEITLLCNSLSDPFSYLPSDRYEVEFYKSDGGIVTVPLLDVKTGLINEDILPQGNSSGNKFNEIEMYDIPPISPDDKSKSAVISYDSKNLGKLTALKLSSGLGMGVEIGGVTSEISMITKAKNGISALYLESENLIDIGGGLEKPVVGNEWLLTFDITEQSRINVILGIVLITVGRAKIHAKLTKVKDSKVLVDSDFLSTVENTEPSQARFIFNPDKQDGTYLEFGKYELILTCLEGTLIGDDNLPKCIAYTGKVTEDKLVLGSAITNQVDVKTDKRSFIVGDGADSNVLVQYVDYASGYTAMSLTIPSQSYAGHNITVINDGVLTSEIIGNRDVYVDANINEIVGIRNFRDSNGVQTAKIFINPNNKTTWDTFVNNDYAITPIGIPTPDILEDNETTLVFRKGRLVWEDKTVIDGALYLRPENRIRATDSGFVFEIKEGEAWIQIGEFTK